MKKILIPIFALAILFCLNSCSNGAAQTPQSTEKFDTAVQLYNFRSYFTTDREHPNAGYADFHEDLFATLAAQGYTDVEIAGYDLNNRTMYGVSPEQFKADVEAAGLNVLSSHTSIQPIEGLDSGDFTEYLKKWDTLIEDHVKAGMKYIVWPAYFGIQNMTQLDNFCALMNEIGKKCKENGISFGYHTHWMEYDWIEDVVWLDYMLEHTNPEYFFVQMDVYWASVGLGKAASNRMGPNVKTLKCGDPVEYFKAYPGRFHSLHIKDHYDIGQSGVVGYDALFRNAATAGVEFIVVEEEAFPDPADWKTSMKNNIDYLNWVRAAVK